MDYRIEKYRKKIIEHYINNWGTNFEEKRWDKGKILQVVPHFSILEFKPNESREMWTYATCGMSTASHLSPIEIHIFSSIQDDSILELLSAICDYHNTDNNLDLDHTLNFGRSWQAKSECTFGLISLPYLDGPGLEIMNLGVGKDVHFYWLIPVTKNEVEYKKKYGLEALEAKFEEHRFNYLNSSRESVV